MKRWRMILAAALALACLAGCSSGAKNDKITVISREEGSGTRSAFTELFKLEVKDADGNKVDQTIESDSTNSTSVMMTAVAGNAAAIGYLSMGSMNDTVKALSIDGAAATVENIKQGTYKVSRPFNIVTKDNLSEAAQAFVDYILSADGQAVVEKDGYIAVQTAEKHVAKAVQGKVVVAGSSSVTPVMEKLKEAYQTVNPDAEIEVQMNDSSTGIRSTIDGICDIGMASRELKDSEAAEGLTATKIAIDGIAVIVSNDNPIEKLTSEQVRAIYAGETTLWSTVNG